MTGFLQCTKCGLAWAPGDKCPACERDSAVERATALDARLAEAESDYDALARAELRATERVEALEKALRERGYHAPGECSHVGQPPYLGYGPNRDRCMMEVAALAVKEPTNG